MEVTPPGNLPELRAVPGSLWGADQTLTWHD
jgi:hypothetical protein